ncbi:hypothetical protein HGRIS_003180 [Hohenbuehelia grisea]|uniref:Uncharacterized protein n=1 Tax=Hohenbuehelia grisea TaxID=104357 RepID=A0ABR3JN90_9AGAR
MKSIYSLALLTTASFASAIPTPHTVDSRDLTGRAPEPVFNIVPAIVQNFAGMLAEGVPVLGSVVGEAATRPAGFIASGAPALIGELLALLNGPSTKRSLEPLDLSAIVAQLAGIGSIPASAVAHVTDHVGELTPELTNLVGGGATELADLVNNATPELLSQILALLGGVVTKRSPEPLDPTTIALIPANIANRVGAMMAEGGPLAAGAVAEIVSQTAGFLGSNAPALVSELLGLLGGGPSTKRSLEPFDMSTLIDSLSQILSNPSLTGLFADGIPSILGQILELLSQIQGSTEPPVKRGD